MYTVHFKLHVAAVWFNLDPLILTLSSVSTVHPASFTFSVSLHGVVSRWFLSISLAASLLAPACVLPNKTASYAGKRKEEFTRARAQTALRSRFTALVFPVFLPFERLPRRLLSNVLFQIGSHSLLHFFFSETSSTPIILQLYASSQPETFDSIAAGNILVAARVLLKIEPQDSKHRKFCFLTTTRETQLYILKKPSDVINKPFAGLSAISDAIKWRQSAEAKQLLRGSCSSGCYDFPPLPQSLESYKRTFSNENPMDLITTVNLGFVLRDLHYRERVRLHIQGIIAALEFVPAASSEASTDLTSGEATSSQLSETPSNDERGKDSSSACSASQTSRFIFYFFPSFGRRELGHSLLANSEIIVSHTCTPVRLKRTACILNANTWVLPEFTQKRLFTPYSA